MFKKLSAVLCAFLITISTSQSAEFINILTGGTSGVYYPLGSALTKIYGDNIKDSKVQVQVTKASVENLVLLQEGKGERSSHEVGAVRFAYHLLARIISTLSF